MNLNREFDELMSRRALELAASGTGLVSPGPLVGCVITDSDGNIVGEGTYFFDKVTHAEIAALEQAGVKAAGGTAYISLEPHSHYGRTPPCTEALIQAGIARVVAPVEDPNPLVSGVGFRALREHGIEVVKGILKREAERLNEKFFHWHRHRRPFVHLKTAASIDGRIATRTGDSKWITGEPARERVQDLRNEYDAVLIGSKTANADNPNLTDRSGRKRRRPLVRIVLDNSLNIAEDSILVSSALETPTLVFTSEAASAEKSARLLKMGVEIEASADGAHDLEAVLSSLAKRDIQSVLVEGGASVAGSFVDARLVDKITVFLAPLIIGGSNSVTSIGGNGIEKLKDALRLTELSVAECGDDLEVAGYPAKESEAPESGI